MNTTEEDRALVLAGTIVEATFNCLVCQTPVFWAKTFPKNKNILLEAEQGGGFRVTLGINKLIALADPMGHLDGSHHRNHWTNCERSSA